MPRPAAGAFPLAIGDVRRLEQAVRAVRAGADFLRLTAGDALVLVADGNLLAAVPDDRDPREPRRVAVVGVDADQRLAGGERGDVLQHDMPFVLRLAVAAGPVELAEVVHLEVADDHRARSVVLEHLVRRLARAAAGDGHGLPRRRA